jgi:hypothetical protein
LTADARTRRGRRRLTRIERRSLARGRGEWTVAAMADDTGTEPSTETAPPATGGAADDAGRQDQPPAADLGDAGKAALAEERSARKAAESRAKTLDKQLAAMQQASMSESEKAVAKAREESAAETRLSVMREFGGRLVNERFRAALTGRVDDKRMDAVLAGINAAQFLTDDGDVNGDAVKAWADALAPPRPASFDGGVRGGAAKATDMNALLRKAAGLG